MNRVFEWKKKIDILDVSLMKKEDVYVYDLS